MISFDVDDSISGFYNRYELVEKENDEYEFQLYEEVWFGKRYPVTIEINNKDHTIKKLIQKKQNEDGYEVICEVNDDERK